MTTAADIETVATEATNQENNVIQKEEALINETEKSETLAETTTPVASCGDENADEVKFPKKKVALVMGYKGTNYQGMQTNPNAKSIESILFKAFYEAKYVSEDNAKDQTKVQRIFYPCSCNIYLW